MFSKLNNKLLHESHNQIIEDSPDKPPTKFIASIVFLSFISVFFIIAISFPLVEKIGEARKDISDTGMGNSERITYIFSQKQILSSFKKIDENYFQIPILQAMKVVVAKQGDVFKQSAKVDE